MKQLISLCIIGLFMLTCSEKTDQSIAIYEQAKSLEAEGKTLEALAAYESLAEYEESEIFLKAEAELLQKGISIKSARSSWTIQKQIKIQNKIMRQHEINNTFPDIESLGNLSDAWGRSMTIEFQPTERHLFKIRSAGPDTTMMSTDDLLLSYRNQNKAKLAKQSVNTKDGEIVIGLDQLSNLESHQGEEIKTDLKELGKLNSKKQDASEQTVDLNELLNKKN